jgi:hypothetical protein
MGGMGLLGMKWGLAGLSAIARCGKMPYYDNTITGITFGADNTFSLDGERLILLQTINSNGVQREFATEMENFSRVYSYGKTTGRYAPSYFAVYPENGNTIEYGNTLDSRHTLQAGEDISTLNWCINKVTDANGNYMTYEYEKSGNEIKIKNIFYTQNDQVSALLQPYAKVQFGYTDLSDNLGSNTCFVGGYGIPQTKLLETITVYYGTNIVRKYEFT